MQTSSDRKIGTIKMLAQQFFTKIESDWPQKYARTFKEFESWDKMKSNTDFSKSIHWDLKKDLELRSSGLAPPSWDRIHNIILQNTISKGTKGNTLDCIAFYVGYKHYQDFEAKQSQNSVDLAVENPKHEILSELDSSNSAYYIYYYTDNLFKANKALLTIESDIANLTFFDRSPEDNRSAYIQYIGKIYPSINNGAFSIFFHTRKNISGSKSQSNPSFCSFEKIKGELLLGVFASSENPISCGIVAAEKTSKDDYKNKINGPDIPSAIQSTIYNSRFIISGHTEKDFTFKKKENIIKKIKRLTGTYEGYTIVTNPILALQRLALEIRENGSIRLRSHGKRSGEDGHIVALRADDRILVIQLDYHKHYQYYSIQIILDLKNKRGNSKDIKNTIIGMYGGVEKDCNDPMGGRIILFSTSEEFDGFEPNEMQLRPEDDLEDLNSFLPDTQKQNIIIKFFKGELDNYSDHPNVITKSNIFK